MLKLMKYELRKTMFSKSLILVVTAVFEVLFVIGVFGRWNNLIGAGITGLVLCAMIGVAYIGIESLLVFHRDLNTKQSYMLFLTPRNSYQVLGAKIFENGISILLAELFFAALAVIDATIAVTYLGGFRLLVETVSEILSQIHIEITISPVQVILVILVILAMWLMVIVSGAFSIVLSATVLAGKKLSGLASVIVFLLVNTGCSMLMTHLPYPKDEIASSVEVILSALVLTAVMYVISGWIMEKKLSV